MRIPKHQDLHFSDFSTNFYGISKFTAKNNKEVLAATIHMSLGLFK